MEKIQKLYRVNEDLDGFYIGERGRAYPDYVYNSCGREPWDPDRWSETKQIAISKFRAEVQKDFEEAQTRWRHAQEDYADDIKALDMLIELLDS